MNAKSESVPHHNKPSHRDSSKTSQIPKGPPKKGLPKKVSSAWGVKKIFGSTTLFFFSLIRGLYTDQEIIRFLLNFLMKQKLFSPKSTVEFLLRGTNLSYEHLNRVSTLPIPLRQKTTEEDFTIFLQASQHLYGSLNVLFESVLALDDTTLKSHWKLIKILIEEENNVDLSIRNSQGKMLLHRLLQSELLDLKGMTELAQRYQQQKIIPVTTDGEWPHEFIFGDCYKDNLSEILALFFKTWSQSLNKSTSASTAAWISKIIKHHAENEQLLDLVAEQECLHVKFRQILLEHAVKSNFKNPIDRLLKKNICVTRYNEEGLMPIHICLTAEHSDTALLQALVKATCQQMDYVPKTRQGELPHVLVLKHDNDKFIVESFKILFQAFKRYTQVDMDTIMLNVAYQKKGLLGEVCEIDFIKEFYQSRLPDLSQKIRNLQTVYKTLCETVDADVVGKHGAIVDDFFNQKPVRGLGIITASPRKQSNEGSPPRSPRQ